MTKISNGDEEDFWYNGKVTRRRFVGWGGNLLRRTRLAGGPTGRRAVVRRPRRRAAAYLRSLAGRLLERPDYRGW